MIRFAIDAPIQPWQRARKRGKRHFTAPEMVAYQEMVGLLCKQAMLKAGVYRPLSGPLRMQVDVSASGAVVTIEPLSGDEWKTTRPDADNLFKNIADAINGVAYKDDAQVAALTITKTTVQHDNGPARTASRDAVAHGPSRQARA